MKRFVRKLFQAEYAIRYVPALIFVFISFCTFYVWKKLVAEDISAILRTTNVEIEALQKEIFQILVQHRNSVDRMAKRFEANPHLEKKHWLLDSAHYEKQVLGVQTLQVTGADYKVKWVYPEAKENILKNYDVSSEKVRRDAVTQAEKEKLSVVSKTTELKMGGLGFLIVSPIFHNGKLRGFLLAAVRAEQFLRPILLPHQKHNISIYHQNELLISTNIESEETNLKASQDFKGLGLDWRIEANPRKSYLDKTSKTPLYVFIGGFLCAVFLCVLSFITLRSRILAKKFKEQQAQLIEAQQLAQCGSWEWDIPNNTLTWSDELYNIYGLDKKEKVVYSVFQKFTHPDDKARSHEIIWSSFKNKVAFSFDHKIVREDGSTRILHSKGQTISDEKGNPLRMYGTEQDVTHIRETEKALVQARETALTASRMKSEFLANMSHEIRTPLNGVIGMSQILLDTKLTPDQKDYAENIYKSAEALLILINDILDFSKIESGKMDLENVDFEFDYMMGDVHRVLYLSAKKKGVALHLEIPKNVPKVLRGDPGRISQILINMIGNAIKFTSKGSITLKLIPLQETKENYKFRIEVIDTGIGISKESQDKLFKAFSQADSSTTRRFGGTGLGLSISKKLIDLMNGKVGLISEEGKGSTFWFELSLEKGADRMKVAHQMEITHLDIPLGTRVLVAEDNPVNQKVALIMLEKLGIKATCVANGQEAIEALRELPYDLVLMDCQMPVLDGYQATELIRKSSSLSNPNIPIVAMTANAIQGDREKCLAVGMNDYISKPVKLSELKEILMKWLGQGEKKKAA